MNTPSTMAPAEQPHPAAEGRLVALEGDIDIISTQLRLLPPSQKILILPTLLENISKADKHSFKPRSYIREVHEAYTTRIETTRSFLEESSASHPRLVLMNGGSVGARAACISTICRNLTNGDADRAEAVFNDIVKDGVAGLLSHEDADAEYAQLNDENEATAKPAEKSDEHEEDPTVKAMKAADSLDRETAALQEDGVGDDSELTMVTPVEEGNENEKPVSPEDAERLIKRATAAVYKDDIRTTEKDVSPEDAKSLIKRATDAVYQDDIRTTEVTIPDRKGAMSDGLSTFGGAGPNTPFSAASYLTAPNSHISGVDEDEYGYETDMHSPGEDMFSAPPTPRVVYGEACVVDVQATLTKNLPKEVRRTRSMESLVGSKSKPQLVGVSAPKLRHSKSEFHLGERPTSAHGRIEDPDAPDFGQLPRTTFVRASTTTIRRTQSMLMSEASSAQTTPIVRTFADRGSDAWNPEELEEPAEDELVPEEAAPYQPVFPAIEDLVIHCVNDSPNEILTSVFQSYKNGTYPAVPSLASTVSDEEECPKTPTNAGESVAEPETHESPEPESPQTATQEEFDPYSSDTHYPTIKQSIPRSKFSRVEKAATPEPPSPTVTLPPPVNIEDEKFCEFSMQAGTTVIGLQNSLRAFLGARFPAGEKGYTQYSFSTTPEADRLWKPVFRNDQNASIGDEGRTVDQIIALGCEDGVKKEFFSQISGQVERLGTKRDGLSRSGKLDLRFLISSALQTFASLPPIARGNANPLNSSTLLATLLVPHLETYLATNPSVRLLILLYPSAHLPTVVALRKLLGQDILKIAGVVDTLSSEPRPRTPVTNPLSNDSTSPKAQGHRRPGSRKSAGSHASQKSFHQSRKSDTSFSKANFLLPNTATDSEIVAFLSGIWKSLVEKSAFYTPEPEPEPVVVEKIVERIVERKPVPPPKSSLNPQTGRESKISRLAGANQPEKRRHNYAPSIASTVRSFTTVRTMGTVMTTATERGRREVDRAWEDFYIGEIDSEDDEYDRMVMGRAGARIVPEPIRNMQGKKRSSKKALKWLGLA